jgi:hypothetical protein
MTAPWEGPLGEWERQQPGDLLDERRHARLRLGDPSHPSVARAWLAVGDVACEPAALPQAKGIHCGLTARLDDRQNLLTPAPAGNFVVLLAEPAPCAQQRAFDHG